MQSIDKGVHRRMALRTLGERIPSAGEDGERRAEELGFSVIGWESR